MEGRFIRLPKRMNLVLESGELARTESVVENDDTHRIISANSTANTARRIHKEDNVGKVVKVDIRIP